MKKLLLSALVLAMASNTQAQKLYTLVHGTYQYGVNSIQNYESVSNLDATGNRSTTETDNPMRMGTGYSVGLAAGYKLKPQLAIELGVSYFLGSKHINNSVSNNLMMDIYYRQNDEAYARLFFINPALVFYGKEQKCQPYTRFGLLIGTGHFISISNVNEKEFLQQNTQSFIKTKVSGNLAYGLNGAVGFNYRMAKNFSLFTELGITVINYQPKKSVLIEATRDGADILNTFSRREKEVEFVDEYTYTNSAGNPDEPSKQTKVHIPLSNVALQLGVCYTIGK
jgi:hypothetical protein